MSRERSRVERQHVYVDPKAAEGVDDGARVRVTPGDSAGHPADAPTATATPTVPLAQLRARATGVADGAARRIDGWPLWVRWVVTAAVLLAVSLPLVVRYVTAQPSMSRADEYVYIDAVDKATRGDLTQRGELIDEYALSLLSCRGVEGFPMGSECGGPYSRAEVPWEGGHTSADIHPPTYFFVTAWIAEALIVATPLDDLLTAARVTGAIWMALGVTMVIALARALGAPRSGAAAAGALILLAPSMRWVSTFVTPDALNLVAGSGVALVAVQVVKGRWRPRWLLVVALLVGAIKAQNALAVGLAVLVLILVAVRRWAAGEPVNPLRVLPLSAAALVASLVPQVAWQVIRSATALGDAPGQGLAAPPLTAYSVLYDTIVFMRGVIVGPNATYVPAWANGSPLTIHGEVVAWILISGVVALALFARDRSRLETTFGRATVLALVLGGPFLRVGLNLLTEANFGTPVRYGMVLLPAVGAATAVLLRRRWVNVLVLVVCLGFYAMAFRFTEHW